MRIALVHRHYDPDKLQRVIAEMRILGTPKIHAVWEECFGHWQALEGCHRIRAAAELGLTPEIVEVEYSEDMCSTIPGYDGEEDYTITEVCDNGYKAKIIDFEEV